ncbi:MAG: TolC family protein [Deltaproteobacteria bacterium]|nr:TolC family protein [Deltaproteobacteria bacterium]
MTGRYPITTVLIFAVIWACLFIMTSCAAKDLGVKEDYIGPEVQQSHVQDQSRQSEDAAAKEQPAVQDHGPLEITVQDAILLALENNRSLKVERFGPPIKRTAEEEARSAFDPVLSGEDTRSREKIDNDSSRPEQSMASGIDARLGVSGYLPTGTDIALELSTNESWSHLYSDELYESRLGLSVTQALLKGAGLGVNLAALRQARLDTAATLFELRGFAETLVAQVEETYWDYALTERQIEIFLESLNLAQQQKSETLEMIKIGYLAESELAAAEAEIALRREGLINVRSDLEKTRLRLLRLINPPGADLWQREIVLLHQPAIPDVKLDDVDAHVDVAMRMRPDLNQARLQVRHGELEIVKTKNGLLPKMDVFINLGKTGYADSFGRSYSDMDDHSYDVEAGLALEYPLVNRQARSRYRSSILHHSQAGEALKNLDQLVTVDVRVAYIEVNRAKEQIAATAATRAFQEEKARIESEKFRVGKSTSLLVAQAQRDLLSSRITEIQATINYLKALIELFRLEGSLLQRRGITAPGSQPSLP